MKFVKIYGAGKAVPALTTAKSAVGAIPDVTVTSGSAGRDGKISYVRIDYNGDFNENALRKALMSAHGYKGEGTTNWTYDWGD